MRLPDGSLAELEHGDLVGRVWSAALPIDDPRVSEAHALVSLREGAFWMLALRRLLAVDGRAVSEVRLEPGVRVELADGLALEVEELGLPLTVRVLENDRLPRTVLPSVCSVRAAPRPQVVGRWESDAPAAIWSTSGGWRLRLDGVERELLATDSFDVDGETFRVSEAPLHRAGPMVTLVDGGVHARLTIVASFDTVQIHRDGEPVLLLPGVQARVVSELAALGGPTSWNVVAHEVWPEESSEAALRRRWDVTLARLRGRLRAARVRSDLLRSDGTGKIELVLHAGDRVEDHT